MKRMVTFAWNHEGLGHVSRLIAVSQNMPEEWASPLFFVQHEQELITSYKYPQIILPSYEGAFISDNWWIGKETGVDKNIAERLSKTIIEESLRGEHGVIFHDVVIYKDLYDYGVENNWNQYYIFRERKDVLDPHKWLSEHAPNIKTFFWLGKYKYEKTVNGVTGIGLPKITRKLISDNSLWDNEQSELKIVVTPGGGGYFETKSFIQDSIRALINFSKLIDLDIDIKIITGPFFKESLKIPHFPNNTKIELIHFLSPEFNMYKNTDIIIAQGGYNTLTESESSQTNMIIYPRKRTLDDQYLRALRYKALKNYSICIDDGELEQTLKKIYMNKTKGTISQNSPINTKLFHNEAKRILQKHVL